MSLSIFFIALFVLQLICLGVGSKIARSIKSQDDYFLAGKKIGFFSLLMTFVATQLGGGMILGATEEAYQIWVVRSSLSHGNCSWIFTSRLRARQTDVSV